MRERGGEDGCKEREADKRNTNLGRVCVCEEGGKGYRSISYYMSWVYDSAEN